MKRHCLPLPTIQAATTKILPTKCLNIAEPRIFCPPKITRYTVVCETSSAVIQIMTCTDHACTVIHVQVRQLASIDLKTVYRKTDRLSGRAHFSTTGSLIIKKQACPLMHSMEISMRRRPHVFIN